MTDIRGACPERFAKVRAAFAANFAEDLELGARFAIALDGEIVIDLWAGHADRARTRPFAEDSLTAVFSTTKVMAALMMAKLVDAGVLAYDQPVTDLWPEFAAAGKASVTVGEALSHRPAWRVFASRWSRRAGSTGTSSAPSSPPWPRCGRRGAPMATIR
jgi:CubicO group peptidase (beta-lactamase class C family)